MIKVACENMKRLITPYFIGAVMLSLSFIACKQQAHPDSKQQFSPSASAITGKEFPLWTSGIPDSGLVTGVETYNDGMITNVSHPSITVSIRRGIIQE